jgi:hypothetical protein
MRRSIVQVFAVGCLALVAAACGGADDGADTAPTTTTMAPTTTVAAEEDAALPPAGTCLAGAEDCDDMPGAEPPGPPILPGEDEGDPPPADPIDLVESPTSDDLSLVDSLVAFAGDPSESTWSALPFAPEVALGLADEILIRVDADALFDPQTWVLEKEPFRARTGPYSALDLLASTGAVDVSVGPHDHCASPPVPAPDGFEDLRRVAIQPVEATSCIEWFTVDLFVDGDGVIQGITLDLYEP